MVAAINSVLSRQCRFVAPRMAWIAICACAALGFPGTARAVEALEHSAPMALGLNLDVLPSALSAANGKIGYAPQVWLGIRHVRLRFVTAHLEPPDAFAFAPTGFHRPTTTVFATIVDYVFGAHFTGPWIGSGFELWHNGIDHDAVPGNARWNSTLFTVGGGYIWRFAGNLFLDPWAAGHMVLDPQTVSLGPFSYKPFPLQGEVSVKIGWFLSM